MISNLENIWPTSDYSIFDVHLRMKWHARLESVTERIPQKHMQYLL